MIYYYKDRPYSIVRELKIKINGNWIDIVEYKCEYDNPDGTYWARLKEEFYNLFEKKIKF